MPTPRDMPGVQDKDRERAKISDQVEEFLRRGGVIEQVGSSSSDNAPQGQAWSLRADNLFEVSPEDPG